MQCTRSPKIACDIQTLKDIAKLLIVAHMDFKSCMGQHTQLRDTNVGLLGAMLVVLYTRAHTGTTGI